MGVGGSGGTGATGNGGGGAAGSASSTLTGSIHRPRSTTISQPSRRGAPAATGSAIPGVAPQPPRRCDGDHKCKQRHRQRRRKRILHSIWRRRGLGRNSTRLGKGVGAELHRPPRSRAAMTGSRMRLPPQAAAAGLAPAPTVKGAPAEPQPRAQNRALRTALGPGILKCDGRRRRRGGRRFRGAGRGRERIRPGGFVQKQFGERDRYGRERSSCDLRRRPGRRLFDGDRIVLYIGGWSIQCHHHRQRRATQRDILLPMSVPSSPLPPILCLPRIPFHRGERVCDGRRRWELRCFVCEPGAANATPLRLPLCAARPAVVTAIGRSGGGGVIVTAGNGGDASGIANAVSSAGHLASATASAYGGAGGAQRGTDAPRANGVASAAASAATSFSSAKTQSAAASQGGVSSTTNAISQSGGAAQAFVYPLDIAYSFSSVLPY